MDGEKFDLEQFPTSESAKRMLSYVTPGFYDNSYVGNGCIRSWDLNTTTQGSWQRNFNTRCFLKLPHGGLCTTKSSGGFR